jgi:regulator of nucleoside diphosphate kinase
METRTIRITENDLKKLRDVIQEAKLGGYRSSSYIHELLGELKRAEVVKPRDIPADVITMNSKVLLTDIAAGEQLELTLVFPDDGAGVGGRVSILAPIGTAMIGYRVGDVFEWDTPGGKTSLRVEKILYQPEESGIFD